MKKIALCAVVIIVLSLVLFGCELIATQADVTITGQTEVGSSPNYYKRVNYTITNTGLYSIDYWEIQFRIEIAGNSYDEYADGYDLFINDSHAGVVDIFTGSDDPTGYQAVVYNKILESN